jgi:mono/diheme cytochrome c family protein
VDSTLTYDNFASDFFSSYCIRCHGSTLAGSDRNGAPANRNYDTLSGLVDTGPTLIDGAAAAGPSSSNTLMPPSDPRPTDAERRQLGQWLACGMRP